MKEHETILIFSRGKWVYNKQMQVRTGGGAERAKYKIHHNPTSEIHGKFKPVENHKISNMRVPSSWQKFNIASRKEKTKHPTQKPVALMEYLIETYTNEGETVLDFTMGSGTTGLACHNLNRQFIGIEKDPEYFKLAENRIKEHAAQGSLF